MERPGDHCAFKTKAKLAFGRQAVGVDEALASEVHERALAIAHRVSRFQIGIMHRSAEMQLRIAHFWSDHDAAIRAPALVGEVFHIVAEQTR